MIPRHPHRTHASQISRKQRRIEVEQLKRMKARRPVSQGGLFAFLKYLLERWFK